MKKVILTLALSLAANLFASEYLVEFYKTNSTDLAKFTKVHGGSLSLVSKEGNLYKWTISTDASQLSLKDSNVVTVQKNGAIHLIENPSLAKNRAAINELARTNMLQITDGPAYPDNPEIPTAGLQQATGKDTMLDKQWGIAQVKGIAAQQNSPQGKDIIVAVTDTGVDYTHPDLINQMWRNEKEIPGNGIDDDNNGYIDDIVGWDFANNDNKPYDLSMSMIDILMSGGNPGHGTHVSGVIGATGNNGMGIVGIAPKVKIMALRFITEKGQGTSEAAIKAIDYAVNNGAKIINASWGGEKGDESDDEIQKAIERAKAKGVLFIAAAGNGRVDQAAGKAVGFNNDTDPKPVLPATFNLENMITVAAIDVNEKIGEFSNYGPKSVHLGAPGVNILSTVPGNRYQDTIIELGSMKVTWDGTSMATPHVVGAAALLWSTDPNMTATTVKEKLLSMTVKIPSMTNKTVTGGRLDLGGVK